MGLIGYELREMTGALNRRKEAKIAATTIKGFLEFKKFDQKAFNTIRVSLDSIRKELLTKEEQEIFIWENINRRTLEFDKKLEGRLMSKELRLAAEHKRELREVGGMIRLGAGQERAIRGIAEAHREIAGLIGVMEKKISELSEVRRAIAATYSRGDEKKGKILENQSNALLGELRDMAIELERLTEKDQKDCLLLRKNIYLLYKITNFLGRDIFKSEKYIAEKEW